MGEAGERLDGRDDVCDISKEVVGDVEFVEFFEGGEIVG